VRRIGIGVAIGRAAGGKHWLRRANRRNKAQQPALEFHLISSPDALTLTVGQRD